MVTRRGFLSGVGAGALVIGFGTDSWVGTAEAAPGRFDRVPELDGTLYLDMPTRQQFSQDLGRTVTVVPDAVLRPGSVADIQKMIRFCIRRRIPVSTRGQGHTTFGQGLGPGLIIENRSLWTIHSIGQDRAEVDAGVLWRELVDASVPYGVTPPLVTTYVGLSIAGTLSMGGVPANNREGIQADRVRELEVVTGTGELLRCSLARNRELFEVMPAGLGQCGVITKAVVDLVPAKPRARTYILQYTDLSLIHI